MINLGQIAYDAYYVASGGKSLISCHPLPIWKNVPEEIQGAWHAAAAAVTRRVTEVPDNQLRLF